jgi:hypothetical protein
MDKLDFTSSISGIGTVGEFWQWAFSNMLGNTTRGVFAEFLVGKALGGDVLSRPRIEWDSCDLDYQGYKIEVKSSAYVQSWHRSGDRPTQPRFGVGERKSWIAEENRYVEIPGRYNDCYVFCLYAGDREQVLDVAMWEFYVITTGRLEGVLRAENNLRRKYVGLNWVRTNCEQAPGYDRLKDTIDRALSTIAPPQERTSAVR